MTGRRSTGRRRKVGLKRSDAAVDALLPLGFSKSVICKAIKDLLAVYDGDHGWPFIEEASYKLLIETILEKQEQEETAEHLLQDQPTVPLLPGTLDDAGTSAQEQMLSRPGNLENSGTLSQEQVAALRGAGRFQESLVFEGLSLAETNGNARTGRIPRNEHEEDEDKTLLEVFCKTKCNVGLQQVEKLANVEINNYARKRRPPTFGWISDDEEYEHSVHSTWISQNENRKTYATKRKTRWDVKPPEV